MRIISLGWGVQSFTIAAMVAFGDLPPVDFAVHADTGWERKATYKFASVATSFLVSHGLNVVSLSPSARSSWLLQDNEFVQIPAFVDGGGRLQRQCTFNWKIAPIRRFVSSVLKGRGLSKSLGSVEMLLGITVDEWQRAKDSDVKYIKHCFPLLEKRMSRGDCINYLVAHGLPVPVKSSCVFCPFHSLGTWEQMKRAGGSDWQTAVRVDDAIRNKRLPHKLYLLRNSLPLSDLPLPEDFGYVQPSFLENDVSCDSGFCFM